MLRRQIEPERWERRFSFADLERDVDASEVRAAVARSQQVRRAFFRDSSDPLNGGSSDLSTAAVGSSDIIIGGLDAQYGNAQSGVINTRTQEGDFKARVRASGIQVGKEPVKFAFIVNGKEVQVFEVKGKDEKSAKNFEVMIELKKGVNRVGAVFLNEFTDPDIKDDFEVAFKNPDRRSA